jgi:hypothetical protein
MANYYSEYPETVNLLYELKDSTMVYFNTHLAAQLKLNNRCDGNPVCITSPANAFLHERLHIHSELLKSDKFLQLGGMNIA